MKTAERKLETKTHAALLRHWQKPNKGEGIGGEGAPPYRTDGKAKQLVKKEMPTGNGAPNARFQGSLVLCRAAT